ncbi:sulfotransferase family protein [Paracidovorax avenae]|uniref:sulfotransferase family protein n=1 Tax=Paracidovorax avenae TaxID=80867 RepID=UPI000D16E981|nr:sulfotransferase family protein [Paracidovorax avenae]AVS71389.1 sulfotransferase family protein [Paracidovorax avenae]AVS81995.1 sulfotransferase family protein [Paracidovorax avenae]AVT17161.1 sulfotransferase family protein [Paracidovorax avenae]
MDRLNFEGWSPIRLYREPGGELLVDWMRAPPEVTRTPFFADGVQNAMQWPFHQAFRRQTPLADLIGWAQVSPGLQPSGIIFHVSRCGSTLVTQAFAALDDHVALSEPPPLDDLLRAEHRLPGLDPAQALAAARAFASAWAQPSLPGHESRRSHLVIKCDCWDTALAGRIAEAWPGTPWLFLYRDPVEVLVSQMQQRAAYLIPGGPLGVNPAGIPFDEALHMGPEAYCARSLGSIYAAMVREFRPGRTLLLDYRQLPGAILDAIAPHFGMQPGAQATERMQATFGVHAKNPLHPFTPDAGRKHLEAPQRLRELAREWIAPHYDALERLRAEGATLP